MLPPDHPIRAFDRAVARLSRRELLNASWKLGLGALVAPAVPLRALTQLPFRAYPFTMGVASGDPLPDGVVLWTRLAPEPLEGGGMPMANVEVGWEIAQDRAFRTPVSRGTAFARPELGHSVHVEAEGLDPDREYFYRFRAGSEVSEVGRTRTAPAAGAPVDSLRFGVCGCSHYEVGYFTAFRHIAAEAFDFVFHTGDYIYEGRADGGQNPRVRQHHGAEIYTLVDYRNRYAQYKSDPDLRAAHASAPFIVTWDDHEVDNDYAGDADEHDTPPEVFLLRRAAAYQAYYESLPLRRATMPRGPDMRLHRRMGFGSLVDFTVLDTRQYRSNQVCGGATATGCTPAAAPERTILGASQEAWLFDALGSARATWTILGQQVPTFSRNLAGMDAAAPAFSMDKWDGYTASRDRLFRHLHERETPNPIVLSGDVHVHYGADLLLDFQDPRSPRVGVEFTNTSVTSGGDGAPVSANWEAVRSHNPHIKYHSNRRGYIACTATPARMEAAFRVVDAVSTPGQPARTDGTLVVEAGRSESFRA
jgi:alkaline phosphatase D